MSAHCRLCGYEQQAWDAPAQGVLRGGQIVQEYVCAICKTYLADACDRDAVRLILRLAERVCELEARLPSILPSSRESAPAGSLPSPGEH